MEMELLQKKQEFSQPINIFKGKKMNHESDYNLRIDQILERRVGHLVDPTVLPDGDSAIVPDTITGMRWKELRGYVNALIVEIERSGYAQVRSRINDTATNPSSQQAFNELTRDITRFYMKVLEGSISADYTDVFGVFTMTSTVTAFRFTETIMTLMDVFDVINKDGYMSAYEAMYGSTNYKLVNIQPHLNAIVNDLF